MLIQQSGHLDTAEPTWPEDRFLAAAANRPGFGVGPYRVRRMMKRLPAEQRAAIVNGIPPCAWKSRDMMPVHKRLLLDYLSGDWALGALVAHCNLQGEQRLSADNRAPRHRRKLHEAAVLLGAELQLRNLERFLSDYRWDESWMAERHWQLAAQILSDDPGGLWSIEVRPFPKAGPASVGVAPQGSGAFQWGIFIGYSSPKGQGLLDSRLYLVSGGKRNNGHFTRLYGHFL